MESGAIGNWGIGNVFAIRKLKVCSGIFACVKPVDHWSGVAVPNGYLCTKKLRIWRLNS